MLHSRPKIDVNDLAFRASNGSSESEKELMDHLSVSFLAFAQQRICNDHDAEEIVQDVLSVIWSKYRDTVFEKSFQAWAYQILKHKIMDYNKKRSNRRRLMAESTEAMSESSDTVADANLRTRLLECLRAVGSTNNRYARILNLNYQGYSTGEICERLGMTKGNCYTLLMRARGALLHCLEKKGGWK